MTLQEWLCAWKIITRCGDPFRFALLPWSWDTVLGNALWMKLAGVYCRSAHSTSTPLSFSYKFLKTENHLSDLPVTCIHRWLAGCEWGHDSFPLLAVSCFFWHTVGSPGRAHVVVTQLLNLIFWFLGHRDGTGLHAELTAPKASWEVIHGVLEQNTGFSSSSYAVSI